MLYRVSPDHPKPYNTNVLLRSRFQDPIDIISQVPFLEISYLVQASGALRIYTLVDLKALEDERKKFDKRKIHGLLQEEANCMKITKKISFEK